MLIEKYRPRTFDEIIGQDYAKIVIKSLIEKYRSGEIKVLPNMLFYGPPGTGKTSMAHVIAHELKIPIVEYNASKERGVSFVENTLAPLSKTKGKRIIFLDEADHMSPQAQAMLRRILEESAMIAVKTNGSDMNVFILSANYYWRIIEPIRSRCVQIPFSKIPFEQMVDRLVSIVEKEGIKWENENEFELLAQAIEIIVNEAEGDMRKALNILEKIIISTKGRKLTPEVVRTTLEPEIPNMLFKIIYEGDFFTAVRELEDAIILNKIVPQMFLDRFLKIIIAFTEANKDKLDFESMKKLLIVVDKISSAEHTLIIGGSPLIQLTGVLAVLWTALHSIPNKKQLILRGA